MTSDIYKKFPAFSNCLKIFQKCTFNIQKEISIMVCQDVTSKIKLMLEIQCFHRLCSKFYKRRSLFSWRLSLSVQDQRMKP